MVGLTGASQFINLGRCIWVLLGPVFIEAKDPEVGEVNCLAVLKKIDHVTIFTYNLTIPGSQSKASTSKRFQEVVSALANVT